MNDESIDAELKKIRCRHFNVLKISVNDDGLLCCEQCDKVLTSDEVMLRYKETYGETAQDVFQFLVLYEQSMRNQKKYERRKKEIEESWARVKKRLDNYYNKFKSKG